MDFHDSLKVEHQALRAAIEAIRALKTSAQPALQTPLEEFKNSIRRHFANEEAYYRIIDKDERFSDPNRVHQLRNDHAAIIFGMESLEIRLRKKGAIPEWWDHFDKLMNVFIPHMEQEETIVYPEAERILTPEEWLHIRRRGTNA